MDEKLVCPKCGSRRFRVISLVAVEQILENGEWSCSEFSDDGYILSLECADCGAELDPELLGYPTQKALTSQLVEVVVAYPYQGEGGVLLGVEKGQYELIYVRPSDSRYAWPPEKVAGAICRALGLHNFGVATLDKLVLTAGHFPIGSWEEVPAIVSKMGMGDFTWKVVEQMAAFNPEQALREGYQDWISDPKRARSGEVDFGVWWGLQDRDFCYGKSPWRVSWIEDTGELYARELTSDRYIVLGVYPTRAEVEARMEGWADDLDRMTLTHFFPEVFKQA